ncbi:Transmembrane emp24 domain-containing protein p24delta3 [Apostasia shenzhenica]|uniref:Transmembrane emp24 domain-containing protein p24delta3 n=1 Tax=Apostasia shenzhenica TaxID=1088818 RepID=A0A2I0AKW4_9ASPA|nr:Transmembrane emp24 domain-containing protein p24delta3 [Apostasia shenzhenica]
MKNGGGSGERTSRSAMVLPGIFFLFLPLLVLSLIPGAGAIWINLPASGTKCVLEEIQPNVVVLADYSVVPENPSHDHPSISAKVTSPYGNTLYQKEKITAGQFAFTTTEAGNYLACFWIDSGDKGTGATVNLDWKIGIAAKDWESVAKKEKIEGVELELRKLEANVQAIRQNLLYLKSR